MSVSIVKLESGHDRFITDCWEIKEKIRRNQDFLNQSKYFFDETYVEGKCYVLLVDGTPRGFGIMVQRSYLAMLGISPDYQGEGLGKRIMNEIKGDYERITCHTRVSNTKAISFYEDLQFEIVDEEIKYYGDGENAAVLEFAKKGN